ncbi:EAL domain-containing protein [Rhizobium sp. CG5]|uniref:putative bifunctional diguanylate cyclase/phosphodiesterase n=1 Tax=Rhizobium sp. CG5 TaxID=2726076 RepID=UPI002033C5A8|nr:EAL domain-containing protein [Rhizobium sp. CG5]
MFIGAVAVALGIVAAGFMLDSDHRATKRAALQERTRQDVQLIQASLNSRLLADFSVVEHLAVVMDSHENLTIEELQELSTGILERNPHFLSLGMAPDQVIRSVWPADAGRKRIGAVIETDRKTPTLRQTEDGNFLLHLPVTLHTKGVSTYWGVIEIVLDNNAFFERSGLLHSTAKDQQDRYLGLDHLDIAIHDISASVGGASVGGALAGGNPIFGAQAVSDREPAIGQIRHPGGVWEIRAVPHDGWDQAPENQVPFRLVIIIAGCAIIIPIFIATLLIAERNRNIAKLKLREEKLLELSERFNLAMESSNIGIWEVKEDGHRLFWDDRAAALHGLTPSRAESDDRLADWMEAVHPEDRVLAEAHFFQCSCAQDGKTCEEVYRIRMQDGSVRYLRSVGAHSESTGESRVTGIVWDVTADVLVTHTLQNAKETSDIKNAELELALDELSSREQQLEELSRRFDLALASYNCGIWEADPVDGGAIWDERMMQLYGISFASGVVTEEQWLNCLEPENRQQTLEDTQRAIARGTTLQSVQHVVLPDGSFRFVRSVGQLHTTRDGRRKIIGIAFDVTADMLLTEELKVAKEEADARNVELEIVKNRIEFNSLHDPLTGLANRRRLDMELDSLTRNGQGLRHKFSILHLDLDRFKEINDTLGHAAGDAMLVNASRILTRNVRADDLVARIGGDEFVILSHNNTNAEHLSTLSARIIEEMSVPIDFEGFSCRCGVSIGIAQAQGIGIDARKVLVNADIALYQAKATGRNCFEFFTPNLQAHIVKTKRMADEILAGLDNDEFTVWYQPQFSANTMQLTGAEALVRWQHPERGILASNVFLKIAEELNVMARIDQLVLEKSLSDKMRWAAMGIRVPKVSVNVSSKRLHDATLIDCLKGLNITPGEISFELVESIFLDENDDLTTANIDRIKDLGIDIEIDDFGTGHTSIVSLLKLKPKRLKIDRQLVMPIVSSPQERSLVRSIIDIARSLGVETVAEGVETGEHAELLRQLGVDLLQGYAFAKPLPFDEFSRLASRPVWQKAS